MTIKHMQEAIPIFNKIGDVITHSKLNNEEYVVVETIMTGGGEGHGSGDIYPDGHQLTLYPINKMGFIDLTKEARRFYQSGSFIEQVMLPYCKPLRNAKNPPKQERYNGHPAGCICTICNH